MTSDAALTILLTLKDRSRFTVRWMSYVSSVGFPFNVLIADGGSDKAVSRILSDRSNFPSLKYEYVRYPYDRSYGDYYAKVCDALRRIQTPFVALTDNDDMFVVSGLRQAVQFLIDHDEYATCGGQCAVFWVTGSPTNDDGLLYGKHVEWKCSLDGRSLTEDTASARLRNHSLRATHPTYYHVRRTADLRKQFEIVRDSDLQDLFLVERLIFFLTAIAGKTKQFDTLYIARQWNSPGSAGGANQARSGDWFGRMLVPSWSRDFTNFVNHTSAALAARDGLTIEEARRSVIESYRMWLAPQLLGDIFAEPTVTLPMPIVVRLFRRLLRLSPDNTIRRAARTLYRRAGFVSVDAIHGTQLHARHVSNAAQEVKPILEFLARGA